jgi:serine protease Do/serine protease DegQ
MRTLARELRLSVGAFVLAWAAAAAAALPLAQTRDGLPSLAPVLEPVTPAVVNISVLQRRPEEQNPLLRDPFFRRFFGLPERPQQGLAAGSGVIVDARNGYIVTNHHVIKDASAVVVTLKDNRRLPARLVGSDAGTDIALLKVDAKDLVEAKFGDSDALAVGDFVVAIGNPFGIGQTVTSGIISALGRWGLSPEGYENFIQTDAPINPGNSGGALINLRGEVIGINTAIIGPGGGNVGIGFAVPSNMARAVMRQLIRFGEVRRGRLGIVMQDLTPELAESLGVERRAGAALTEVQPGSPAADAGLRVGDIVVGLNGSPVHGSAELRAHLGVIAAGESIDLRILRGREERVVRVRIAEIEARHGLKGRKLEQLSGAAFADTERGGERAVLVTEVAAGTVAFQYGLRPGDLVIGVNGKRVGSVAELAAALRADGRLALGVVRGEFLLTIPVRQ